MENEQDRAGTGEATQEGPAGSEPRQAVAPAAPLQGAPANREASAHGARANPEVDRRDVETSGDAKMTREEALAVPKGPGSAAPGSPGAPTGPINMPSGDPTGRRVPQSANPAANPPRAGSLAGASPAMDHPDLEEADRHFQAAMDIAHKPRAAGLPDPCTLWAEIRDEVGAGIDALEAAVRLPALGKLGTVSRLLGLFEGMADKMCGDEGTAGGAPPA